MASPYEFLATYLFSLNSVKTLTVEITQINKVLVRNETRGFLRYFQHASATLRRARLCQSGREADLSAAELDDGLRLCGRPLGARVVLL